jgi:hypothetical protein
VPANPLNQPQEANSRITKLETASLSHVSNPPPPHGRGVLVSTLKPARPSEVYHTCMQSLHANVQIQTDQDRSLPRALQLIIQ